MDDGRARTFLAAAFAAVFMTSPASAQENRPIKITSPYTSGSGPDVAVPVHGSLREGQAVRPPARLSELDPRSSNADAQD